MNKFKYTVILLVALIYSSVQAEQNLYNSNLSFNTVNQSMWDSGNAFIFDYKKFIGLDVNPGPAVIGSGTRDQVSVAGHTINPYFQFDTDFKVGVELGAHLSSGSIDANVDYGVSFSAPDIIRVGEGFSLSGMSSKLGSSSFSTSPATASAYIDGIIDTYLGAYARIEFKRPVISDRDLRLGNQGFSNDPLSRAGSNNNRPYATVSRINERKEIIGINRNASGVIRYLGGQDIFDGDLFYDQLGAGDSVNLGPISATAGNFNLFTNGNNVTGNRVSGSGSETLVTVALDIDQLVVGSAALGQSISHDWGAIDYYLGYDIVDLNAALDINLQQSFNIDSNLIVTLNFSENVVIEGIGETDIFTGTLDDIPLITLLTQSVEVTPEFLVDAMLHNETGLGFVGSLNTTILEAGVEIGWNILGNSGEAGVGYGPLYQNTIPVDLGSITAYNNIFGLGGFSSIVGESFTISAVPIPASVWLLASSLIGLLGIRKKT